MKKPLKNWNTNVGGAGGDGRQEPGGAGGDGYWHDISEIDQFPDVGKKINVKTGEEWLSRFDEKFAHVKETDREYYNPWLPEVKAFIRSEIAKAKKQAREETARNLLKHFESVGGLWTIEGIVCLIKSLYLKTKE